MSRAVTVLSHVILSYLYCDYSETQQASLMASQDCKTWTE